MARKIRAFWLVLFAIRTVSVETVISCVFFLFSKAGKFKTNMTRVPYNKLLTNLASSSRTGEYWPSVVFVRTSLRSVRTATTSGQYTPVRPSRSVSKRLVRTEKTNLWYLYCVPDGFRNDYYSRGTASNFRLTQPGKIESKTSQFEIVFHVFSFELLLAFSLATKPSLNFSGPYRRIDQPQCAYLLRDLII